MILEDSSDRLIHRMHWNSRGWDCWRYEHLSIFPSTVSWIQQTLKNVQVLNMNSLQHKLASLQIGCQINFTSQVINKKAG